MLQRFATNKLKTLSRLWSFRYLENCHVFSLCHHHLAADDFITRFVTCLLAFVAWVVHVPVRLIEIVSNLYLYFASSLSTLLHSKDSIKLKTAIQMSSENQHLLEFFMSFILLVRERQELARRSNFESFIPVLPPL